MFSWPYEEAWCLLWDTVSAMEEDINKWGNAKQAKQRRGGIILYMSEVLPSALQAHADGYVWSLMLMASFRHLCSLGVVKVTSSLVTTHSRKYRDVLLIKFYFSFTFQHCWLLIGGISHAYDELQLLWKDQDNISSSGLFITSSWKSLYLAFWCHFVTLWLLSAHTRMQSQLCGHSHWK